MEEAQTTNLKIEDLEALAVARERQAGLKAEIEKLRKDWENSHRDMLNEADVVKAKVGILEERIRAAALLDYAATGSKKLLGGVGIRVNTELEYNEEKVFGWAKEKQVCLTVDWKAFTGLAKAGGCPELVTLKEKPTATIPTRIAV